MEGRSTVSEVMKGEVLLDVGRKGHWQPWFESEMRMKARL